MMMLPLVLILRFLKHVLAGSPEARQDLSAHRGKLICVEAPLGPIVVCIDEEGYVERYSGDEQPSLIIKLSPDVALNWLKEGELGWRGVRIEGDAHFASDLSHIVSKIDWDYEEDLSRVFGDVIAHRLGELLRGFGRWLSGARHSMKSSLSDYLTEESRLLVTKVAADLFIQEVDELSDAVSRFEKRVAEVIRARYDNQKNLNV